MQPLDWHSSLLNPSNSLAVSKYLKVKEQASKSTYNTRFRSQVASTLKIATYAHNSFIRVTTANTVFLSKIESSLSRLDEFGNLEENWDSYGAPPLDKQTIEEARTILKMVESSSYLRSASELEFYPIPNRSGGVSLYFELGNRELRIKFYPNESCQVAIRVNKTNPEHFNYIESDYERSKMIEHFTWLSAGHE